jgi:hypothetical protein
MRFEIGVVRLVDGYALRDQIGAQRNQVCALSSDESNQSTRLHVEVEVVDQRVCTLKWKEIGCEETKCSERAI